MHKQQTPAERILLQPAGRGAERIVGAIALVGGASLCILAVLFAVSILKGTSRVTAPVIIVDIVLVALASLLTATGARLSFNISNEFGSLLPPQVWYVLCAVMLLLAAFFVVVALTKPSAEMGQGIASALLLALLSYGTGSYFNSKKRGTTNAA